MGERIRNFVISMVTGSVAAFITVWLLVNTGYIKECYCTINYTTETTKQYSSDTKEKNINIIGITENVGKSISTNIVNNFYNDANRHEIQLTTEPEYNYVGEFSEGLADARKEQFGKYGYIDREGNIVIDFKFKDCGRFKNGKAVICDENGKWGMIDKNGNIIIEPQYDKYFYFNKDGTAEVRMGFRDYIIDENNNILREIKD